MNIVNCIIIVVMSQDELLEILSDNGFSYYKNPVSETYIIPNLEMVKYEPMIRHIHVTVSCIHKNTFIIYASLMYDGDVPREHNFGLHVDMSKYIISHNTANLILHQIH